jgi:hypothetical protein
MKKILSLLVVVSALGYMGCDDGEDLKPAPVVTLSEPEGQGLPGVEVSTTITVDAPYGGSILTFLVDGDVSSDFPNIDLGGQSTFSQELKYAIPSDIPTGTVINVLIQAIDNKNYPSAITTWKITVGKPLELLVVAPTGTTTLTAEKQYLIKSQIFVESGAKLVIPAGTILKGDKATKGTIIVKPGGQLEAVGTADSPIIFTSAQIPGERDKGDWGGLVILGNAYVNQSAKPSVEGINPPVQYGSLTHENDAESSGKLKYVRVEYAGIELSTNNETNSITLGGVGSGTEIDHVQVSFGGDDGFEWFGGTVNAKHLVSHSTWDDDFDTDYGWSGNVQFAVIVRNPFFADQSGSTAFESDNAPNANATTNAGGACSDADRSSCTKGVFSNVTVLGPRDYTRGISGNYTRAMHIRRRTTISIFNSVITGFATGLSMDDQGTIDGYTAGAGVFKNNVLFVPILPNSSSNSNFASGNAYYSSSVAGAATGTGGSTGTIFGFWENNNANIIVKGLVATKGDGTFAGNWASTAVPADNIINPYTDFGLATAPFWAGSTPVTYPADPNFAVTSGSLTGLPVGELFPAASKVDVSFFDKTATYKGAFGATDWTDGWAKFQPTSEIY